MSFMSPHWQASISATSIYGSILDFIWSPSLYPVVAAVATITVSFIFFRQLCKTRNKQREKGISKQGHLGVTLFRGSSNFNISNTDINAIGGNATIIKFGDGQFTEIQRNLICDYIANLTVLPDINDTLKKHVLTQSIITLPRAEAVFNDYQAKKKSGPCFEGTRVGLLREMADWATGQGESKMYVLSGLAGIGKSTVAYTIASRAADLDLLGASFFFSRDEADRNNAKRFFCTIAYQLCVYDEAFAKVIGNVLLTERGSAATTKDPQEQLKVLILDPLRSIVQSRARLTLVVVDALDECDEEDEHAVVMGLSQLVRLLPSFKVILTTRPQPLVNYLFWNHDGHEIFYLQDIEDKVVDGDIRLYLSHSLSHEQVRARLLNPMGKWCASDEDIESLVRVAGRLFIIASTAVLYVLNRALGDPGARMKRLLGEIAQDRTPFHALNHFYFIIVRSAVQVDDGEDDNDHIVERYQIIVGTIVVIQTPLPITTLACFVGEESEKIYAILRNLQSVILLGSDDVPRIYHKSFPDYLTDPARCKDPRLRIDPRIHHTQIARHCFEIMNQHLKYNILGLGDSARFMSNEDGLKEDGITDEQLQEKIPRQLRYACVYWVNHLEVANVEDVDLMNGLTKFANEQILYWFEVLSLIGKLDSAHRAIRVVLKLQKLTSSDLPQLLSDALRFISKFYEVIERSGLHACYSALPFAPTESLLYRRYIKEAVHRICDIEGGPEKWDALIANLSHGERSVTDIKFSLDSALFASCSEEDKNDRKRQPGKLKIWDATTGTPISTISGHIFAIANDLSSVASSEDNIIIYYNGNGNAQSAMFSTSSRIRKLALSSENSRVAAALSDGTVSLWQSRNGKLINSFDGFDGNEYLQIPFSPQLQFSATGTRIAYSSTDGIVKLRDGISGGFIADLQCGSRHKFVFSGDGSRIASLSRACGLTLWNSESGGLIGAIMDSDGADWHDFAISADGSLLATSDRSKVTLWSGNSDSLMLAQIDVLEHGFSSSMAFSSDHILAIKTNNYRVKFYSTKTHSFIATLSSGESMASTLAFSPNCTRFALGTTDSRVYLWDFRGVDASSPPSKEEATRITALALSRDGSRLACGFEDGTVELWETSPTKRRIASHHVHSKLVGALGFGPNGGLVTSASDDGTIKLWNGGDGSLLGTLEAASDLRAVAISNSVLVVGGNYVVTLWGLDTLSLIHTFEKSNDSAHRVSIAENSALIAVFYRFGGVSLLDAVNHTTVATFDVPYLIDTMTFLPDNSQLVAQSHDGAFLSYNLMGKDISNGPTLEHLIRLPNTPLWHGLPVWHCRNKEEHYLSALLSQHKSPVPVLWIPRDLRVAKWTQNSSMIALGCKDGRTILIRLTTSHIG